MSISRDINTNFSTIIELTKCSFKFMQSKSDVILSRMEQLLTTLNIYGVLLFYNHVYLFYLGNIDKVFPTENVINDGVKVEGRNLLGPMNLSDKEKLFLSSFVVAFKSTFKYSGPKFNLSNRAIQSFYQNNYAIKIFMNILMIHPAWIRFAIGIDKLDYYIYSLLNINMSPWFIFNMIDLYEDAGLLPKYDQKLFMSTMVNLIKTRNSLKSPLQLGE